MLRARYGGDTLQKILQVWQLNPVRTRVWRTSRIGGRSCGSSGGCGRGTGGLRSRRDRRLAHRSCGCVCSRSARHGCAMRDRGSGTGASASTIGAPNITVLLIYTSKWRQVTPDGPQKTRQSSHLSYAAPEQLHQLRLRHIIEQRL